MDIKSLNLTSAEQQEFDAELKKEKEKYIVEVWDRKSPINGVSAKTVLASHNDIPDDGEIYLIKDANTGGVIYFQPHMPGVSGLQPITDGLTAGNAHVQELAEQRAIERVLEARQVIVKE